jgi:hypothetical protein
MFALLLLTLASACPCDTDLVKSTQLGNGECDDLCATQDCLFDHGDCPPTVYVSITGSEQLTGTVKQPYKSLYQALAEVQSPVTVYLLAGTHQLVPNENVRVATLELLHAVTIQTIFCGTVSDCASEAAMIQLQINFVQIRIRAALTVINVTFEGGFSLLENCMDCTYCPTITLSSGQIFNDRGESIAQAASQSSCNAYAGTALISVASGATLTLNSVTFANFRQQLFALIWSSCGFITLSNVTFSNVVPQRQGLSGAVVILQGDSAACGSFNYTEGLVELINNGYEYASDDGTFSGFARIDQVAQVEMQGVTMRHNFLSRALVHLRRFRQARISSCTFLLNIVTEAPLYLYSNATFQPEDSNFTHITIQHCSFSLNYGSLNGAISLTYTRDHLNTFIKNCTFTSNSADTFGLLDLRNIYYDAENVVTQAHWVIFSSLAFTFNHAPRLIYLNLTENLTAMDLNFRSNGHLAAHAINEAISLYTKVSGVYAELVPEDQFAVEECVAFFYSLNVFNLTVTNSSFRDGLCLYGSPGLQLVTTSIHDISNIVLDNNTGSSIYATIAYDLEIRNLTCTNNTNKADLRAACIHIEHTSPAQVRLLDSVFGSNHALANTVAWVTGVVFLLLQNVVVSDNVAETSCAGINFMPLLDQNSALTVRNASFLRNQAKSSASLQVSTNGYEIEEERYVLNLQIVDSVFAHNQALNRGSGVTLLDSVFLSDASTVSRSTFQGNQNKEGGAAIYAEYALGKLTLSSSLFTNNTGLSGAAVRHRYTGVTPGRAELAVRSCNFTYNSGGSVIATEGQQRCVYSSQSCSFQSNTGSSVLGSNCVLSDLFSIFYNNTAERGAALRFESSIVTVAFGFYIGNSATSNGGVLYSTSGSQLSCHSCEVSHNKASTTGGAVYMDQDSFFGATSVLFQYNYAGDRGSVIYAHTSTMAFTNVTFKNNQAKNYGSLFFSASKLNMTGCDMSYNLASSRSPGLTSSLSTIFVTGCKFHDQTGSKGGSFFLSDQSVGTVSFSEFWNNTSGSGGAFVIIALSTFSVIDSNVHDCSATDEGGILTSRISTITFTRTIVRNIKSVLTYGAFLLLQSTFTIQSSSFSDLSGSLAYGLATTVIITNSTVNNVYASLGATINCAECPKLLVSNSQFTNGVAQVGGVINSYTKGTSASVMVSAFTNNLFANNSAVVGGAIYSDSLYMNLTNNIFLNNSASSSNYASATLLSKGQGGAVFCMCTSIDYCVFLFANNTFNGNRAEVSGGGLFWADSYPLLTGSVFADNEAVYGQNVASFAVKLVALNDTNAIIDYLDEGENPLVGELTDVGSGYVYKGKLRLALVDQYGNVVATDDFSSAQLLALNTSEVKVSGNTQVVASQGVFEFSNYILTGPPLTTQQLRITTNGINLDKKASAKDPSPYYASVSLRVSFRDCVPGESLQSSECRPCPVNTFSLTPTDPCKSCPSHVTCYGTNQMVPEPGYWRPDSSLNLFFKCMNPDACLGSPDPTNPALTGVCANGYSGNLCNKCDDDYSSQGNGLCSKCPSVASNLILCSVLGVLMACLFILIVIITLRGALRPRSELAVYLKILLNYVQMLMVASSLNLNWPAYVEKFLRGQQAAGNAADQLLSVECMLKQLFTTDVYYTVMTLYVVLPAILLVLCAVWWLLATLLWRAEHSRHKLVASLVLVIFVLHTSLTKVLFSAFTCRELLPGEYWLASNLSIRCWNTQHVNNLLSLAMPGILIWVIGLPTLTLLILVAYKRQLGDPLLRIQYSFLYKGYRSEWYFWEFVILYRKIVIVCTSVFLTTVSIEVQALSMLAVMLACLFLQLYVRPFIGSSFNSLELKSLLASLLTIYAGLYFQTNSTRMFHTEIALDIALFCLIIIANAYFLLGWLRLVIPILITSFRERLAALRKYQVRPMITNKISKDLNVSSKIEGDGSEVPSAVHPETFEVPNNTSFFGAVTPIQEDALE